jgi:hypothetical protein
MPPESVTARNGMTCAYGLGADARDPPPPPPLATPPPEGAAAAGASERGAGAEDGRAPAGAHELTATAAAAREPNQSMLRTMPMTCRGGPAGWGMPVPRGMLKN